MLKIAREAAAAIRAHAAEGYPLEICGFLVGTTDGDLRTVREAWPVRNAWEDDPEARARMFAAREAESAAGWESEDAARRYLVSPRDTVGSMKRAREAGMDLVGIYHTHPEHPAVPSEFDREAAWPEWSYVILSVRGGAVADFRSWTLDEESRQFWEEAVEET